MMFGMITSVGLSNLQFVDLNSTRNLFVLGFSIFFSLVTSNNMFKLQTKFTFSFQVLPQWVKKQREAGSLVLTTVEELDQIIVVLLETSMFVGGFLGFFLDNTIPGTPEERGITAWNKQFQSNSKTAETTYDLPFIMPCLYRVNWARYIPFLPVFDEKLLTLKRKTTAV